MKKKLIPIKHPDIHIYIYYCYQTNCVLCYRLVSSLKTYNCYVFNVINRACNCFIYVSLYLSPSTAFYVHNLNMFRLSYPAIVRELIIVDNKHLVTSHSMVITHVLQFVFFVIYVDLTF
jgi:hypothetical protein